MAPKPVLTAVWPVLQAVLLAGPVLCCAPARADETAKTARIVVLKPSGSAATDPAGPWCTPEPALCLDLPAHERGAAAQLVVRSGTGDAARSTVLTLEGWPSGDDQALDLWDRMIVLPDQPGAGLVPAEVLIGIRSLETTPYSGGGAQAVRLHLLRLRRDLGSPRLAGEVLDVPLESSVLIRACFSEKDMRNRAGACHDEYRSGATITLVQSDAGDMPVLDYAVIAESFPGGVSRGADSLQGGRLHKRDLVWKRDEVCSFTQRFTYDPTTRRYAPASPGPDCSDFDVP